MIYLLILISTAILWYSLDFKYGDNPTYVALNSLFIFIIGFSILFSGFIYAAISCF